MKFVCSAILLFAYLLGFTQPKLPSIFTSNMVLQQKAQVPIWGWSAPGSSITVKPTWDNKNYSTKTDASGKWKLMVSTPSAGGPYEISISDGKAVKLENVLIGEVWLCSGQSNMEMPMKGFRGQPIIGSNDAILRSKNKNIRLYIVPRSGQLLLQDNSKPSEWKEAEPESVSNFSATAYYFGLMLFDLLGVPIGLVNSSYGGSSVQAWMNTETLKPFSEIKIPPAGDSLRTPNRTATALYNGMIHPILGYGIKGAIWYQGESNYDNPDQYEQLFPAMVKQWRSQWNSGDFPFYFAQIAPYNYVNLNSATTGSKSNSAYLRDAQRKSVALIPNSGMAVLLDLGDEHGIHPGFKKPVGERLAMLALAKTYGMKGFGYESPAFDSLFVKGNIAEIKFKHTPNGLTTFGKELTLFEVAGADKVFYPATVNITRTSVLVSTPMVREPVAVRYAFKNYLVGELFSNEGLPVSSFRTDNW